MTLTAQEIESAACSIHDLGPGYPQIPLPDYIRTLYADPTIHSVSMALPPDWTGLDQREVAQALSAAVREFLKIDIEADLNITATFSGSLALSRAIRAAELLLESEGVGAVSAITTSPSIDIIMEMLTESRIEHVELVDNAETFALNVDKVLAAVELVGRGPAPTPIVVLCSPENPTGVCWTTEDLARIAKAVLVAGGVLIVDHSFAWAGVQQESVPTIWSHPDQGGERWIGVWDTGKTFGLNEDKLGFLIHPPQLGTAVHDSLAVLQFAVARRSQLLFAELLHVALERGHVASLRQTCRENLSYLRALLEPPFGLAPVEAGTLALVVLPRGGPSDSEYRRALMDRGIGVVSGRVFFHTQRPRTDLLRIALAREPSHFREAVDVAVEVLQWVWGRGRTTLEHTVSGEGDD